MPSLTARYPRGSEWRKWDLHVHTPMSPLNNGFGSDFEAYAKILLEKAVEKGIATIGITDYFSIEGYKQLKAVIANARQLESLVGAQVAGKARQILLLPNIEFRTSVIITRPGGQDSRVNFHVIFSDNLEPSMIEESFLRELKFTAESNPGSADARWSLTLANLEHLGNRLKAEHAHFRDKGDLHVGMMTAVVAHEDVTAAMDRQQSRFKDKCLVVLTADEDLSRCSWDGQGHLARKLLLQKSHMLFSSNPGTREFGLGKKHPTVADFVEEFKSFKPCINGSDSHTYESLFEPAGDRHLWIKADPTFEGLRQVLNEPEDRVFIGALPESLAGAQSRSTRIVKSVTIRKRAGVSFSERWFDSSLVLNPELVAIIGNKGSGKSALADVLGLLGNTPRSASFSFLNRDRFRDPRGNKARHFEASLSWADGTTEGPLSLDQDPAAETVEKIKYIPQDYLEKICNEVQLGKGSQFYAELQKVIFSHVPESDRLGFDSLDELLDQRGAEIGAAVDILVAELRELNREIASYEQRLAPRYRKTVELQLAEKRRELQAHEQVKPKEIPKPEDDPDTQQRSIEASAAIESKQVTLLDVEGKIVESKARDGVLAKKRSTAEKLSTRFANLQRQVSSILNESTAELGELGLDIKQIVSCSIDTSPIEQIIRQIDTARADLVTQLDANRSGSLEQTRLKIVAEIETLKTTLTAPQRSYQDYLQKLKEWEAGRSRIQGSIEAPTSILQLETILAELDGLPLALRKLSRLRNRKMLEIFTEKWKLRTYYESYYGAVQGFLSKHPLAGGDRFNITFNVAMVQTGFSEGFLNKINQRKTGAFAGVEQGAAEVKRLIDSTNWDSPLSILRFAAGVIHKLKGEADRALEVSEQLKQCTPQELYDFVYSLGYLSPIYRLTWQGKGLEQLSPGERGNMLLIFYLLVDRDNLPLVIDQPEENLDNQTVVKTLVPCMKDAKARRQIVMVTHNPNLAVVCDAEQVIYADIRKEHGNEVTYLSGSIEDPVINKKIVDVLEGTRPAFDKRDSKYLP